MEKAAELSRASPEGKRQADEASWVSWIEEYRARLASEDDAAARALPPPAAGRSADGEIAAQLARLSQVT